MRKEYCSVEVVWQYKLLVEVPNNEIAQSGCTITHFIADVALKYLVYYFRHLRLIWLQNIQRQKYVLIKFYFI